MCKTALSRDGKNLPQSVKKTDNKPLIEYENLKSKNFFINLLTLHLGQTQTLFLL